MARIQFPHHINIHTNLGMITLLLIVKQNTDSEWRRKLDISYILNLTLFVQGTGAYSKSHKL